MEQVSLQHSKKRKPRPHSDDGQIGGSESVIQMLEVDIALRRMDVEEKRLLGVVAPVAEERQGQAEVEVDDE